MCCHCWSNKPLGLSPKTNFWPVMPLRRSCRGHYLALRPIWGLRPDTPLAQAITPGMSAASVLVAGPRVEGSALYLAANGCEVTGIAFSPDNKSMFVNIQHPENWPYTDKATDATPAGGTVRPRASTVVIQRDDGGEIGTA